MNLKVAHLISVQFGIFVGVVICLVFSHFESFRAHPAAETRKPATERVTTVEPKSVPEDQPSNMEDDAATPEESGRLAEQSTPAMPNEYSPEAVEKSMAILTKLYYEQISPRRSASQANNSIAEVPPSYTEAPQEPRTVQLENPAPQTVVYQQATQLIVYSQPAPFIVFSQPRRFVNRRRPAFQTGAFPSNPHRHQDSGRTQVNGLPASCPPHSVAATHRGTPGVPKR
jgi:hypothetical protein